MTKGFYQYGADPDEVMLGTLLNKEPDVDAYWFLHGVCTIFAIALNKEYGYPIYMLRDYDDAPCLESLVHVCCIDNTSYGKRHYIDARGVTDNERTMLSSFDDFFSTPVYEEVAPEDLEELCINDFGQDLYQLYATCANRLLDQFGSYYDMETFT